MSRLDVVMFSGGVGSWFTAKRVVDGGVRPVLLFADTRVEADDLYTFIREAADQLGCELVVVADGRTPFEVFRDDRFLGNSRLANCSKFLKQKPCRQWIEDHCDPETTTLYVGIDWTEIHRLTAIQLGWAPYTVAAPLCEAPYVSKTEMRAALEDAGLTLPQAYADGFPHNNCMKQGCVRGGQAYWRHVLRTHPQVFAETEREEQSLRDYLEKPVTILTEIIDGKKYPITLREFRERTQDRPELVDSLEWGGCGCFVE